MFATDEPKESLSASTGPLTVESFISMVLSMEPSVFMNRMCRAPRLVPESSSNAPLQPTVQVLYAITGVQIANVGNRSNQIGHYPPVQVRWQ